MRIAIFEESDNIRGGLVKDGKIRAFDLEIGALGAASIDAVSYTHLDVYKRQP